MRSTRFLYMIGCVFLGLSGLHGQKVLQMERSGSWRTQKMPVGTELTYRLKGDPTWYQGEIVNLYPEDSIVLFHNRLVKVDQIKAFRRERGWPRSIGRQLLWFGAGWSGFALLGTATDNDPSTHYEWSDAIVTGSGFAASWLLPRMFRYRKTNFGGKRHLRVLDLNPQSSEEDGKPLDGRD